MDETLLSLMGIVGPVILLVLLLWLVLRRPSAGSTKQTEDATERLYDQEEERRREGTDDL